MYKGILFLASPAKCSPPSSEPMSYAMLFSHLASGYQTGLNWKDNYRPGGPSIFINFKRDALLRKAWFLGFDQGLKDRGSPPIA